MCWYTIADFYTPHLLEMNPWPNFTWTGTQFTLGPYPYYYWIGDLAENFMGDYTDDHIFGIRVGSGGSDCNIHEWTRTGAQVQTFGHSAWNYISQRGVTYCKNNDKWYVGGWNSDRVWEYDHASNTNTAEMSCLPGVAGLCYDDVNDPVNEYLWVQHNSTSDQLDKFLIVKPVPDLDIDNNGGSVSGNTVELTGFRGGTVVADFIVINTGGGSSLTAPNVDYWDGPSQRNLDVITYSSTDLQRLHPANGKEIPASCVTFTGPSSLINPNSAQCFVQVNIPWVSGGGQFPWTYAGEASAVGEPEYDSWTTDYFNLVVNVVAGQGPGDGGSPPNAFWSVDNSGATELRWGDFTFGNGAYNLYKAEGQSESFVKLNGSLMHNNSFVDGNVLDGRTYAYKLGVVLGNGEEFPVGPITVTRGLRPEVHLLSQNFPNPVSDATEIRYGIASDAEVSLKVYNAAGQLVETLVDGYKTPGYYSASWNAEDAANGVYFYRLTAGDFSSTGKLVVLR
jgi:hypothetical protein